MTPEAKYQMSSSSRTGSQLGSLEIVRAPQLLVWKALAGLLAFDLLGFGQNFARMHRFVCRWKTSALAAPEDTVGRVCAAINYACVWYPKRVLCVQRSAVTTCLLRQYGIPAKMAVGAQGLPFKAHAWTEVGGTPVNERRDVHQIYQVLVYL